MADPTPAQSFVRRLSRVPLWAVFVAVLALTVGGLLLHGVVAAVLLGCVAALLGVLAAVQWPLLVPAQRGARVLMVLLVAGVAVYKLVST